MEEKNIALLGFISSAADYLKDQTSLDETKEFTEEDLNQFKDELSERISSSFDNRKNCSDDLLNIGKQVFNDFINKKPSMIEEFDEIFDVDFKKKNDEKDIEITNRLMKLLLEPVQLEKPVVKIEEEKVEQIQEIISKEPDETEEPIEVENEIEVVQDIEEKLAEIELSEEQAENKKAIEEVEETTEEVDNLFREMLLEDAASLEENSELLDELLKEEIKEENSIDEEFLDVTVDQHDDIEQSNYETAINDDVVDEYVKIIAQNVLRSDDDTLTIKEAQAEMDNVFIEIINNEDKAIKGYKPLSETLSEIKNEKVNYEEIGESSYQPVSLIEEEITEDLSTETDNNDDSINAEELPKENEVSKKEAESINQEEQVEEIIEDEKTVCEQPEDDGKTIVEQIEEIVLELTDHEVDTIEETKEVVEDSNNEDKVDETIDDNQEESYPVYKEENHIDYVNQLIDEFAESQIVKQIEESFKEEEKQNKVFFDIKELFPYLSDGFIRSVYGLKEMIAEEYAEYEKVIVLHRVMFTSVDNLRRFVELVLQHEYLINADEVKMIVDVFKLHNNVDGKILTDIFEIANQGKLLNGEYEGYRVITDEDDL